MKIMLICAAGMSTSLLVKKMQEAAEKDNIDAEIFACPELNIWDKLDGVSIILLAPQVRFLKAKMEEKLAGKIPVEIIDMKLYGMIKGEEILKNTIKILEH